MFLECGFISVGGHHSFYAGGLTPDTVSASVIFHNRGPVGHDGVKGNTAYFRVFVDTYESDHRGSDRLPDSVMSGYSKPELIALHEDLTARRTSKPVLELAKTAARATICTGGTLALDDRPIREGVPLTPSQQAQVHATLEGKTERVLDMTAEDFERLEIGFVLNRKTVPVPKYYYKTHAYSGTTSARIRLKCVF
jgi:hypothetical protein